MKLKIAILSLALFGSVAMADSVMAKNMTSKGSVTGYSGFSLSLRTQGGRVSSYSLGDIQMVQVDGMDEFNAAEKLYHEKKYADAIEKYEGAASSARDYYKELIRDRRYSALQISGRTASAIKQWAAMAKKAKYSSASLKLVPSTFSPKGNQENTSAIAAIDKEISRHREADKTFKESIRPFVRTLLNLKLAIARHDGNTKAKLEAAKAIQLFDKAPEDPEGPKRPTDPNGSQKPISSVYNTMDAWGMTFDAGNYDKLITELPTVYPGLKEPHRSGALLMLGRAHLARYAKTNNKKDLLDAGLNFLSVSIESYDSPYAPESLYRLAEVNTILKNPVAAQAILKNLVTTYSYQKRNPWVIKAKAKLGQ
ncbi:MAG: hypothetical protein HN909_04490 [Phycisphaerales bacterium]|jgi:hypothetical protein|nr:hypothetical protein [Phycisphaerales bacterium]MBT7171010.1 hypothetical protein [Phycisphaerales bacterium]